MQTLGNPVRTFQQLETFPAPPGVTCVVCTSDEVTAVCPVTGQPDWYTVTVTYRPAARCIESKSLKLYFQTFREAGLFGETFASMVVQALGDVLAPKTLSVRVIQKSRGGIAITSYARWEPGRRACRLS